MKPTREQVLQWAREAGLIAPTATLSESRTYDRAVNLAYSLAYEAGRKDENEACAAVCDKLGDEYADTNPADCAFAIRARGQG